ncbi:MAG: hypothetical protein AAGF87_14085, partial [Bacteroidota bacterium]
MLRFAILLLLSQLTAELFAQSSPAELREVLTSYAESSAYNGNFLVAQNGEIVFEGAFGYADFDTERE